MLSCYCQKLDSEVTDMDIEVEDLDFLFGEPVKDYKASKKEIKKLISEIKDIEKQAEGKLIFNNYQANADELMIKIRNIEKKFKNNALNATAVQSSRRNHEEESSINFIAKKDEMIDKVSMFVQCFNALNKGQRMMIYYSLFKGKQNEFIAQKIFTSERTVRTKKKKAIEALLTNLVKVSWIKEFKFKGSESAGSGFSYAEILERVGGDDE